MGFSASQIHKQKAGIKMKRNDIVNKEGCSSD